MKVYRIIAVVVIVCLVFSCSFFDSGVTRVNVLTQFAENIYSNSVC